MDDIAILNEVRRRVVSATGINPLTQLKISGKTFDPAGLSFWVEEFLIGGTPENISNMRSGTSGFLIQYDFSVPGGCDTSTIYAKAKLVENEFNINSLAKQKVNVSGIDCFVRKISISSVFVTQLNTVKVLITIEVSDRGG